MCFLECYKSLSRDRVDSREELFFAVVTLENGIVKVLVFAQLERQLLQHHGKSEEEEEEEEEEEGKEE